MRLQQPVIRIPTPIIVLWAGSLTLAPIYIFRSGMPQPGDWALAAAMTTLAGAVGWTVDRRAMPVVAALSAFIAYACFVNGIYATLTGSFAFLRASAFLVFDAAVFCSTLTLLTLDGRRAARFTRLGLVGAFVVLAVAMAVAGVPVEGRTTLLFNNPNQLGYFALAAATVSAVLARRAPLPLYVDLGFHGMGAVYTMLSLSKAAMVAYAVLIVLMIFSRSSSRRVRLAVVTLMTVGIATVVAAPQRPQPVWRSIERLSTIGRDRDDTFAGRGYLRILENPEYAVFGTGEGMPERWGSHIEIHSTLGTIVFSYGTIGALLFFALTVTIVRYSGVATFLMSAPLFLYGLTHNGLREPLFWMTLAAIAATPRGADSIRVSPATIRRLRGEPGLPREAPQAGPSLLRG